MAGVIRPRPPASASLSASLREDRRDREQIRRQKTAPPLPPVPLVKLDETESPRWKPGTAWLDMSVVLEEGDL